MRRAVPLLGALSLLLGCAAHPSPIAAPSASPAPSGIPEHPGCRQAPPPHSPAVLEQDFESADRRYVGGTVHALIPFPTDHVASVLADPNAWRWFVPRVIELEDRGLDGPDRLVELDQGVSVFHGRYTLRVRSESDDRLGSHLFRFWVDRRYPHALDDAWGWFLLWPCGPDRTLLAYHVRIDLGPGLARLLFEGRIRIAALVVPQRLAAYIEGTQR